MIDGTQDWHTHSTVSDGVDDPTAMAAAAAAAGLTSWGLSDHVRADTTWGAEYVQTVRALRPDGVEVRCGVEAKMLDRSGRLDLPPGLRGLDYVLIADHQFPGNDGPEHPAHVRAELERGARTGAQVIEQLVGATAAAVRRSPFPPVVVHLFSLLPKCGLTEDDVPADLLAVLAEACRATGAPVEVNQKWRCPSERVLLELAGNGVTLVAGSDAHRAEDVGRWSYQPDLTAALSRGRR